jgi:hypothetical protein
LRLSNCTLILVRGLSQSSISKAKQYLIEI